MDLNARTTRLRPPSTVGSDGAARPDWHASEGFWSKADYWCSPFQPVSSDEALVGQDRRESTHVTTVEPGADIVPSDRLRYQGNDYAIQGRPDDWTSSDYGQQAHWHVFLRRVTGG